MKGRRKELLWADVVQYAKADGAELTRQLEASGDLIDGAELMRQLEASGDLIDGRILDYSIRGKAGRPCDRPGCRGWLVVRGSRRRGRRQVRYLKCDRCGARAKQSVAAREVRRPKR